MRVYSGESEIKDWGFSTYAAAGWSWLNAIRRSCLCGAGCARFPDGMRLMEDNIFMLRVLPRVGKVCQGEVSGYLYRQRPISATSGKRSVQTVVRLFDEAAPFFADASRANALRLSRMLGGAVVEWRKYRDDAEAGADEAAIACVLNARKASMFSVVSMPARWWPGFAALLSMRSFLVLDLLLRMQGFMSVLLRRQRQLW